MDHTGEGWDENEETTVVSITLRNPNTLQKVEMFLGFNVDDTESVEEIRQTRFSNMSVNQLNEDIDSLLALEEIANNPPKGVSLYEIVLKEANKVIISEYTNDIYLWNIFNSNPPEKLAKADEVAKLWLLEFAEFVRDIIRDELKKMYGDLFDEDEDMPHRKYPLIVSRPRKYFFPE